MAAIAFAGHATEIWETLKRVVEYFTAMCDEYLGPHLGDLLCDAIAGGQRPYNAVLSFHQLAENSDECFLFSKQTLASA